MKRFKLNSSNIWENKTYGKNNGKKSSGNRLFLFLTSFIYKIFTKVQNMLVIFQFNEVKGAKLSRKVHLDISLIVHSSDELHLHTSM